MSDREAAPEVEASEFARIREQCNLSLLEVARLLDCDPVTWHHQETGRRHYRRFGALARAVPWLVRGDLPPWCEKGAQLAVNPRLLAVHARRCERCWDTLQAAAQVLLHRKDPRGNLQPNIRLQEGKTLKRLRPWWKSKERWRFVVKRPCSVCSKSKLSPDNKSGVCRECQRQLKEKAKRAQEPHVWDWKQPA